MACAHGPEGCPQLALRSLVRSRDDFSGSFYRCRMDEIGLQLLLCKERSEHDFDRGQTESARGRSDAAWVDCAALGQRR